MGRPLRVEYEGAWYHVSNAAISNLSLFNADPLRDIFFELIDEVNRIFNIEIHAYVLSEDAYDLLVRTRFANLSKAMQHLNSNYSQKYNRYLQRRGPLFCGRFRSIVINADMYLLQVNRYLHWLPVTKHLSSKPEEYPWSSCRSYLYPDRSPAWLNRSLVLERFGKDKSLEKYRIYLNAGVDPEMAAFYNQKNISPVLGPRSFRKQVLERVGTETCFSEVPAMRNLKIRPLISDIVDHVDNYSGSYSIDLTSSGQNISRNLSITLCREMGGYSLREIAEAFNINHHRSVSVIINRTRKKMKSDSLLHSHYKSLKKSFTSFDAISI